MKLPAKFGSKAEVSEIALDERFAVAVKAVRLLVRAAVLRLQDQTGTKGMNPACAVVLAGVVGYIRNSRQAAGGGGVIVKGAVAEPEKVLGA